MGKISELDMAIKDLRSAAATINDVADTLAEVFGTESADEAPDAAAPAETALTLEQVRAVLADKSR
ncbi:MAG: DNA ligase, partial [Faecousia sp.]